MPALPGVYRMFDAEGQLLYVGKAKSLKNRVASYLNVEALVPRMRRMVESTARMEVTITRNEAEALLVEATLVKKLQPRYNILLRDDKSFPYIRLSDHAYPQIVKYRGPRSEGEDYYGPFVSVRAVDETITLLQRAFLLRPCADTVFRNRTRPCLQYQIKRCSAPCVERISREDYAALVRQAKEFLSGRSRVILDDLIAQMERASAQMDYETAAALRDRIRALSQVQSEQALAYTGGPADVVAMFRQGRSVCIMVFCFRHGRNFGSRSFFPAQVGKLSTDAEIMEAFIAQFYQQHAPPGNIFVSHVPQETALLEEALGLRAGSAVSVSAPVSGKRRGLIDQAVKNAEQALRQHLAATQEGEAMMRRLQELFGLDETPQRIEVYDNSHIMGSHPVGAMIVAGPEGYRKNAYRKFKMDSVNPGDDYAMMQAMLSRRFKRAESSQGEWELPEIMLIDGGLGQLNIALSVMADLGVQGVSVAAIAKGPDRNAGREKIFMPGKAEPVELPHDDALLHYLQRLRDEAHRFAITFHRGRRNKAIRNSGLDDIPSIGPQRRKALLLHFGSVKAITGASAEDLARVPGISPDIARRIYEFYHGN